MQGASVSDLPDILDDGTLLADLQAAMQAAWIADERELSADLARRYKLYDELCLRCAGPSRYVASLDCYPGEFFARLCQPCQHEEVVPIRARRSQVKPVRILDGTYSNTTRIDHPFDIRHLQAALDKLKNLPPITFKFRKLDEP